DRRHRTRPPPCSASCARRTSPSADPTSSPGRASIPTSGPAQSGLCWTRERSSSTAKGAVRNTPRYVPVLPTDRPPAVDSRQERAPESANAPTGFEDGLTDRDAEGLGNSTLGRRAARASLVAD